MKRLSESALPEWRQNSIETRVLRSQHRALEAARELLGRIDHDKITMAAIANHAGLNEVTLYKRFGSKQRLLAAAVFIPECARLRAAAQRDLARCTTTEAVRRHLVRVARLISHHPDAAADLLQALAVTGDPGQLRHMAVIPLPEPLALILAAGQANGDVQPLYEPAALADQITTLLLFRMLRWHEAPSHAAQRITSLTAHGYHTVSSETPSGQS